MRRLFLILVLISTATTTLLAQVGFEGGLNMANLAIQSGGSSVSTNFLAGAVGGLFADLGFSSHIYLELGAFYQNNGATVKGSDNSKYMINTIEFPMYIEYRSGFKCGRRFLAGIGGYVGDNINGFYDYSVNGSSSLSSTVLRIGTDIKGMDYGIAVNIGYLGRRHIYYRARYMLGLDNEVPNGDAKNSLKQSSGALTIGYMIRGCRSGGGGGSHGRSGNHWRGLKKNHWSRREIYRRPDGPARY